MAHKLARLRHPVMALALSGMLLNGCGLGDGTRTADVEFRNNTEQGVFPILVPTIGTLDEALARKENWELLEPGNTRRLNWTTSVRHDLSARPLCDELASWYILSEIDSPGPDEIPTSANYEVLEIIETPCWDSDKATYEIEEPGS